MDYLGNIIAVSHDCREATEQIEMNTVHFDMPALVIVWSGQNNNSRFVSSGSYHGILTMKFPDGREERETILIPVKQ